MPSLIPSRLRRQRTTASQTLAVLAGRADMSPQHLSDVESGKVDPRLSTIERIAESLGLSLILVPKATAPAIRRMLVSDERRKKKP
ncbi:MAG: helix-turn-helix transcriptional regulator [Zoogloeaceae bacterium]|nr:helix-turn-helix transcriptional regulator [Zoogloeaceae bacterium]